jgi:acyl carrier protein
MGLDTVELIMAFEQEFDVRISDEDASQMATVGQTCDRIVSLLQTKPQGDRVCATARSFYRLRAELLHRDVERHLVRGDATIGALVPQRMRREWPRIADAAGLRREPNVLFRSKFPDPHLTLRALVAQRCKAAYRRIDGSIDQAAVFERIRSIVAEQLGISRERIQLQSRYIDDLGAG